MKDYIEENFPEEVLEEEVDEEGKKIVPKKGVDLMTVD